MSDRRTPAATARRAGPSRTRRLALGIAGLAALLGLWWLATDVAAPAGSMLQRFGPAGALPVLVRLVTSPHGLEHIGVTLQRLAVGMGVATALGIPLGLAVGASRTVSDLTGPAFQFVRMISPLAWTPVAIIVFGVGNAPVYFLVAAAAMWPIVLSTAAGVQALAPGWLLVARSLGATRHELLRTIAWPGVRGHVVTGVRVALGTAWIVIVPAEMLGVSSGLGYAILDARDRLSYDELAAIIVVIGLLGFLLDTAAQQLVRAARPRPQTSGPPTVDITGAPAEPGTPTPTPATSTAAAARSGPQRTARHAIRGADR